MDKHIQWPKSKRFCWRPPPPFFEGGATIRSGTTHSGTQPNQDGLIIIISMNIGFNDWVGSPMGGFNISGQTHAEAKNQHVFAGCPPSLREVRQSLGTAAKQLAGQKM